jgi:hypothetical protein
MESGAPLAAALPPVQLPLSICIPHHASSAL